MAKIYDRPDKKQLDTQDGLVERMAAEVDSDVLMWPYRYFFETAEPN
jgi:hypothetical protein